MATAKLDRDLSAFEDIMRTLKAAADSSSAFLEIVREYPVAAPAEDVRSGFIFGFS